MHTHRAVFAVLVTGVVACSDTSLNEPPPSPTVEQAMTDVGLIRQSRVGDTETWVRDQGPLRFRFWFRNDRLTRATATMRQGNIRMFEVVRTGQVVRRSRQETRLLNRLIRQLCEGNGRCINVVTAQAKHYRLRGGDAWAGTTLADCIMPSARVGKGTTVADIPMSCGWQHLGLGVSVFGLAGSAGACIAGAIPACFGVPVGIYNVAESVDNINDCHCDNDEIHPHYRDVLCDEESET